MFTKFIVMIILWLYVSEIIKLYALNFKKTEKRELMDWVFSFFLSFVLVVVVAISWATPAAYGGFQARDWIGAVATGLRQSHSNAGSEPPLRPTPQLTATLDR